MGMASRTEVDRRAIRKACPSPSHEELKDVHGGATQPFLMRFASPISRDRRPRPPGTSFTEVSRETTDDR